jgi:hypothetical protein
MGAEKQVRRKAVWGCRVVVLALAALAVSCGDQVTQGKSSAYLILESLQGASGAEPDKVGTPVASDVVTVVSGVPTIFADPGEAEFSLALKDAGVGSDLNVPTTNNYITVTSYRVVYKRADGRNTPGVDVPYPFDGALTLTVGKEKVSGGFTLVRSQAKQEPPLAGLIIDFSVISTIAEVTFYGHDQAGRDVSVTGTIEVNFADWGDPKSAG